MKSQSFIHQGLGSHSLNAILGTGTPNAIMSQSFIHQGGPATLE
jgi:hypothetical protein